MTRFARARGSKSSNERIPEEATSWQQLKQQLQQREAVNNNTIKSKTQNQLIKHLKYEERGNTENTWAEFDADPARSKKGKKRKHSLKREEEIPISKNVAEEENLHLQKSSNDRIPKEATSQQLLQQREAANNKRKSKTERHSIKHLQYEERGNTGNTWAEFDADPASSKKRKKRKHLLKQEKEISISKNVAEDKLYDVDHQNTKIQNKKSGKKFKEKLKTSLDDVSTNESYKTGKSQLLKKNANKQESDKNIKMEQETHFGNKKYNRDVKSKTRINDDKHASENSLLLNKKHKKDQINKTNQSHAGLNVNESQTSTKSFNMKQNKNGKRKGNSKKKDKPYKRRKPEVHVEKMFINGMEIEIVKVDGFPVKKEDAERLKELRHKLQAKGVPMQEVNAIMKLERRKAEKALAREKKKVCFHCRKSGHVLSQCPEIGKSEEFETGICFKCGSTEHTHFECKVNRGQEFRYAHCFICKEQGHISRQCPDNPRGLFPKGGACKECGDVTHLKKDCPDLIKEKEEQTLTLGTLHNNSLEVLEDDLTKTDQPTEEFAKKKKKVIKF